MKTLLINFYADFGRMGSLDGKTLIRESLWKKIQNRRWYASDVLGKHSEIWGDFNDEKHFTIKELTDDQVDILAEVLDLDLSTLDEEPYWGISTISINPFDHIRESSDDNDDNNE